MTVEKIKGKQVRLPYDCIPLGTIVHTEDGRSWVYYGYRLTTAGTMDRHFIRCMQGKKCWSYAEWEYNAVMPKTLIKKFPDIAQFFPEETKTDE